MRQQAALTSGNLPHPSLVYCEGRVANCHLHSAGRYVERHLHSARVFRPFEATWWQFHHARPEERQSDYLCISKVSTRHWANVDGGRGVRNFCSLRKHTMKGGWIVMTPISYLVLPRLALPRQPLDPTL